MGTLQPFKSSFGNLKTKIERAFLDGPWTVQTLAKKLNADDSEVLKELEILKEEKKIDVEIFQPENYSDGFLTVSYVKHQKKKPPLVGIKRKRISGLGSRKKRKSSISSAFKPPTMKKPLLSVKKKNTAVTNTSSKKENTTEKQDLIQKVKNA